MSKRVGNATSKALTEAVVAYKNTKNGSLLPTINNLSKGLIGSVYKYYGMLKFPEVILEEITEDCQSHILLKAIDAFDVSKRTEFSTFYTWRLKSYIRAKRNYYIRRSVIALNTRSMDAALDLGGGSQTRNLHDYAYNTNYSYRTFSMLKRELADLFNI